MFAFGDGFDLYSAVGDAAVGYWDSVISSPPSIITTGRFTGSQAVNFNAGSQGYIKSSGNNDAVHHIVCAIRQTAALSGSTIGVMFQFSDGATAQCSVGFRQDGAMVLYSGTPAGTVLATYTGAITAINTWYAFEFEVVIHPTAGSFTVRKNGNTGTPDFSATSLNTRPGTNTYANKLTFGTYQSVNAQIVDDVLWRSDPSSVPWVGDIRCYTRMPASDQQAQFSRGPLAPLYNTQTTTTAISAGTARYTVPATAPTDCTIGTVVLSLALGYTGNMKCSIFASSGSGPQAVLGSATPIVNPATGNNTFTFSTPVPLSKGQQYVVGFDSDTSSGTWNLPPGSSGYTSTTSYASFPVANPVTVNSPPPTCTINYTPTSNYSLVNEAQQDGVTTYIYDSNPGDADFYGIAPLAASPVSVVAVGTRMFVEKSDAGSRTAALQLKSGSTTVSTTAVQPTTTWGWMYRHDVNDPATGATWTPTAVNNVQLGPTVVS